MIRNWQIEMRVDDWEMYEHACHNLLLKASRYDLQLIYRSIVIPYCRFIVHLRPEVSGPRSPSFSIMWLLHTRLRDNGIRLVVVHRGSHQYTVVSTLWESIRSGPDCAKATAARGVCWRTLVHQIRWRSLFTSQFPSMVFLRSVSVCAPKRTIRGEVPIRWPSVLQNRAPAMTTTSASRKPNISILFL